jgi:hypothetical protein
LRGIDGKFSREKIARAVEQIEVEAGGALFEMRLDAVDDARVACHRLLAQRLHQVRRRGGARWKHTGTEGNMGGRERGVGVTCTGSPLTPSTLTGVNL